MLDNGMYGYSNEFFAMLIEGTARPYRIEWYGDLAEWEINVGRDADASSANTPSELIQSVFELVWTPEEEDVYFYPEENIPWRGFPDVHPDGLPHNLVTRDSDMPFLRWLFDEYQFLD